MRTADLDPGLLGDAAEQARVGDVLEENRGAPCACGPGVMMAATSRADASASVDTPCGAMNSMP